MFLDGARVAPLSVTEFARASSGTRARLRDRYNFCRVRSLMSYPRVSVRRERTGKIVSERAYRVGDPELDDEGAAKGLPGLASNARKYILVLVAVSRGLERSSTRS